MAVAMHGTPTNWTGAFMSSCRWYSALFAACRSPPVRRTRLPSPNSPSSYLRQSTCIVGHSIHLFLNLAALTCSCSCLPFLPAEDVACVAFLLFIPCRAVVLVVHHKFVLFVFAAQVEPMEVLLRLESSSKWPDELEAVRSTGTAFLIRLAQCLEKKVRCQY